MTKICPQNVRTLLTTIDYAELIKRQSNDNCKIINPAKNKGRVKTKTNQRFYRGGKND